MLEEAASIDSAGGVDASSWEAPKEISSSLLDELAATEREWLALVFILNIYRILYNQMQMLKKIRQHLPYTVYYPNPQNLQIFTIATTNWPNLY